MKVLIWLMIVGLVILVAGAIYGIRDMWERGE